MTDIVTMDEMRALPAREISDPAQLAPEPLVSVLLITYNQEHYIAQAIEGVLMQKCDFPFELLIGEDCSSDRTLEICQRYQAACPHLIRLFVSEKNVGVRENFFRIWGRARGKYIAQLEGDDYWTHPGKLAAQAALLEARPESTLCFSPAEEVRELTRNHYEQVRQRRSRCLKETYGPADAIDIVGEISHTSTFVMRRDGIPIPRWLCEVLNADTTIVALYLLAGPAVCFNESTAVYRVTGRGIYSGIKAIQSYEDSLRTLDRVYHMDRAAYGYVVPEHIIPSVATILFLLLRLPRSSFYLARRPDALWRIARYSLSYPLPVARCLSRKLRGGLTNLMKRAGLIPSPTVTH